MNNFNLKKYISEGRLYTEPNLQQENTNPELKLERILNELEELTSSNAPFSGYPQFQEGMELLFSAYNEYMMD